MLWRRSYDHATSSSINHHGNYSAMSTNVDTKLQLWWLDERPVGHVLPLSLPSFQPSSDFSLTRKILLIKYTRIVPLHSISFTFSDNFEWTFHPIVQFSSVEISIHFVIRTFNKYKIFPLEILFIRLLFLACLELMNKAWQFFDKTEIPIPFYDRLYNFFSTLPYQKWCYKRFFLFLTKIKYFSTTYFHWTFTFHIRVTVMFETSLRKLVALFARVYEDTICTKCFLLL